MEILIILSRYLHVMSAILAIGGAFFMRFILPSGLAEGDAGSREAVFLRCRRLFKMVVHSCVGLLLLTGAFNTWRNWGDYSLQKGVMHGLWGMHVLLGLGVMTLALVLLTPRTPPTWHKRGAAINILIMLLVVVLASGLKFMRDRAVKESPRPAIVAN